MILPRFLPVGLLVAAGCTGGQAALPRPSVDPAPRDTTLAQLSPPASSLDSSSTLSIQKARAVPPTTAAANGMMPLDATRVTDFAERYPSADGRGVLVAILDSGIDLSTPGLATTTTGQSKILDLRDFSEEGRIEVHRLVPQSDDIEIAGVRLKGFSRVRAVNATGPWFGGALRETGLGPLPGSDLNGDGDNEDFLPVVVTKATDGWVLFTDSNGDGSLDDEAPVRDYLVAGDLFSWRVGATPAPMTIAANLSDGDAGAAPVVDLFFDQSSHGTHVAAITAGHDMFGVSGFDGVAPGAYLIGLKISNNAHGGISVTGSKLRAIDYAIKFAQARSLPLVFNLSFGVGNELEGTARIDAIVDSILALHPDITFVTSAGNDGPGLSTLGFPASARRPLTIGATWPAVFSQTPVPGSDIIAFFSSRGGEMAKPDILAPGFAYATIPEYDTGEEIKNGTSMASPHAAGLVARLLSAQYPSGRPRRAAVKQALMVTARPFEGAIYPDQGTGLADLTAAYEWLLQNHETEEILVSVVGSKHSAVYLAEGVRGPADTMAQFLVERPTGSAPTSYQLRSSAEWLRASPAVEIAENARITVSWDPVALTQPGQYSAAVTGWTKDTTAGPAFRLIVTVVTPDRIAGGYLRRSVLTGSSAGRVFFTADSARPFDVRISSTDPRKVAFGLLNEPGGQPYRVEAFLPAGMGPTAAEFSVDGRDASAGVWQASVAGQVGSPVGAVVEVFQSPIRIASNRTGDSIRVELHNLTNQVVTGELFAGLVGGERGLTVTGRGGQSRDIPISPPDWAGGIVVDVEMPREEWSKFTDFGMSFIDSSGKVLESEPLNYHTARLTLDLNDSATPIAAIRLLPGFANNTAVESWQLSMTVRLYANEPQLITADSAIAVELSPTQSGVEMIPFRSLEYKLPDAFSPLGQIAVMIGERVWSREVRLAPMIPAVRP